MSITRVFFSILFIWLIAVSVVLLVFTPHTPEVLNLRESVERVTEPTIGELEKSRSITESTNLPKTPHVEDNDNMIKLGTDTKLECSEGSCSGGPETDQGLSKSTNLQQTAHLVDPSYHNTMAKLGTDLRFDLGQCPTDSYMLNRRLYSPPKHSNCPTLYIVGARKGGTSSLYQYVSKHPDFQGIKLDAGPKVGETLYFHRPKIGSWKHYISLFPTTRTNATTGESSVAYLVGNSVPKILHSFCGKQAKVVMLFRDPVKRLESNFLMRVRYQTAKLRNRPISNVVTQELNGYFKAVKRTAGLQTTPMEWSKLVGLFFPARNMVFEGLYYVHLLNWLCNFPAENILVINSEEFFENPSKILDIVFQFLELKRLDSETYNWITSATYNRGTYDVPSYQKLSPTDIENLLKVYKPFNEALLEMLQWENHQWLLT